MPIRRNRLTSLITLSSTVTGCTVWRSSVWTGNIGRVPSGNPRNLRAILRSAKAESPWKAFRQFAKICIHPSLPQVFFRCPPSRALLRTKRGNALTPKKSKRHPTGGVPRWSPTLVLVARSSAYVWQSGRDDQFSLTYSIVVCVW
jgi:hypothetical protein